MADAFGEKAACSVHGRTRTTNNLEDDGEGGMKCKGGFECNGIGTKGKDGKGGGGWGKGKSGGGKSGGKGYGGGYDDGWGYDGGGGGDFMEGVMSRMMGYMGEFAGIGGGWGGNDWSGGGGDGWSEGGWGAGGGGGGKSDAPQGIIGTLLECTTHGKKRSSNNLIKDGQGGYMCCPGFECNGKGSGSGKGAMPGDWRCPSCNDHQFARNSTCRKCGAAKPDDATMTVMFGKGGEKPGDWSCPSCNDHQFARNPTCRKCGAANPNGGGAVKGQGGKGGVKSAPY